VYVYVYVYVYIWFVLVYVYMCMWVYVHMYVHVYVYVCVYLYGVCVCVYVYMYVLYAVLFFSLTLANVFNACTQLVHFSFVYREILHFMLLLEMVTWMLFKHCNKEKKSSSMKQVIELSDVVLFMFLAL